MNQVIDTERASDRVSQLVEELASAVSAERERGADLVHALAMARAEAALARAQSQAAIEAARDAAVREREEADRLRRELADTRAHFQQIVDTQTLQLLELTRDLAAAPAACAHPMPAPVRWGSDEDVSFDAIEAALALSSPVSAPAGA